MVYRPRKYFYGLTNKRQRHDFEIVHKSKSNYTVESTIQ